MTGTAFFACGQSFAAGFHAGTQVQEGGTAAGSEPRVVPIDGRLVDPEGRPVAAGRVAILDDRQYHANPCPGGLLDDGCFDRLVASGALRASGRSRADGRFTLQVPGGLSYSDYIWAHGQDARGISLKTSWPIGPNRPVSANALGDVSLDSSALLTALFWRVAASSVSRGAAIHLPGSRPRQRRERDAASSLECSLSRPVGDGKDAGHDSRQRVPSFSIV
jgi:hypothetical protein